MHLMLKEPFLPLKQNVSLDEVHQIQLLLWVLNAPTLTKETKVQYMQFFDNIIKARVHDQLHDELLSLDNLML